MTAALKRVAQSLLSEDIIAALRTTRDRSQLFIQPLKTCIGPNLRNIQGIDVKAFFPDQDDALESLWQQDKESLDRLIPNSDKRAGVNPGDRRALYYLMHALKPKSVLEVGTHIGMSTLFMAHALKTVHSHQDWSITSVDICDVNTPESSPSFKLQMPDTPLGLVKQLGHDENVSFHTGSALEYMKNTDQRFDFIFLDGDHGAANVYQEIAAAVPLLNKDGVILLHDYYHEGAALFANAPAIHGPYLAVRRVLKENTGLAVLPILTLPWETRQGSSATSLAFFLRGR